MITLSFCLKLLDGGLQGLAILFELGSQMCFQVFHASPDPVLFRDWKGEDLVIRVVHSHQLDHALDDLLGDVHLDGVDLVFVQVLNELLPDRLELLIVELLVQSVFEGIVLVGHSIESFV